MATSNTHQQLHTVTCANQKPHTTLPILLATKASIHPRYTHTIYNHSK